MYPIVRTTPPSNRRPISNACRIFVALLLGPLTGCDGGTCNDGDQRCNGNQIQYCSTSTLNPLGSWTDASNGPCALGCYDSPATSATCIDSLEVLPGCAQDGDPVCWNGGTSYCAGGHPSMSTACGAGLTCTLDATCGALCTYGSTQSSSCGEDDDQYDPFCDPQGDVVTCNCGYIIAFQSCGAPNLCQTLETGPTCSLSPGLDPRCGDPSQPESGFCTGGMVYDCEYGYAVDSGPDTTADGQMYCPYGS